MPTSQKRLVSYAAGFYSRRIGIPAGYIRRDPELSRKAVEAYETYRNEFLSMKFYTVNVREDPSDVFVDCLNVVKVTTSRVWFCQPFKGAIHGKNFLYISSDGAVQLDKTGVFYSSWEAIDYFKRRCESLVEQYEGRVRYYKKFMDILSRRY